MADISMCSGLGCPLKKECYRHTAPKSEYQSYFSRVPYNIDVELPDTCKYFWDNNLKESNDNKGV